MDTNSWKKHLLTAKFRDAEFHVQDVDTGIGRRNIVHQYPNKDVPFLEDLGLDADELTINGYVIQKQENDHDYFPARNKLMAALKKEGPGTLIHPFLGTMQVCISGKARVVEDFSRGGMAKFTMTFIQLASTTVLGGLEEKKLTLSSNIYDSTVLKEIKNESQKKVDDSWLNANKKNLDTFVDKVNTPDLQFSKRGLIADCTKVISMTKQAIESVRGSIVSNVSDALSILSTNLTNVQNILDSPYDFAEWLKTTIDVFLYLVGIDTDEKVEGGTEFGGWSNEYKEDSITLDGNTIPTTLGESVVNALVELTNFGEEDTNSASLFGGILDPINITTKNRAQQSLNRLYMVNVVRNLALASAARVAVRINFTSYDKALEIMNQIVDGIENQLEKMGDEAADETYLNYSLKDDNSDMYGAMEDLRKDFVIAMQSLGVSLAVIVDYLISPYGMTTLELAYDKYYDLDRAEDIFDRNRSIIDHPGFLLGGRTIKILSE